MQTNRDGSLCLQRAQLCWQFSWTSPVNLNVKYLQSEVLLMSKAGRTGLEVKKAPGQEVSSRNRGRIKRLGWTPWTRQCCSALALIHTNLSACRSRDFIGWCTPCQLRSFLALAWASMGCFRGAGGLQLWCISKQSGAYTLFCLSVEQKYGAWQGMVYKLVNLYLNAENKLGCVSMMSWKFLWKYCRIFLKLFSLELI